MRLLREKETMQLCSASLQYPRNNVPNVQLAWNSTSSTHPVQRAAITHRSTKPATTLNVKLSQASFLVQSTFFFFLSKQNIHSKVDATAYLWALTKRKMILLNIKIIPEWEKFTKWPHVCELEAAIVEQCTNISCRLTPAMMEQKRLNMTMWSVMLPGTRVAFLQHCWLRPPARMCGYSKTKLARNRNVVTGKECLDARHLRIWSASLPNQLVLLRSTALAKWLSRITPFNYFHIVNNLDAALCPLCSLVQHCNQVHILHYSLRIARALYNANSQHSLHLLQKGCSARAGNTS